MQQPPACPYCPHRSGGWDTRARLTTCQQLPTYAPFPWMGEGGCPGPKHHTEFFLASTPLQEMPSQQLCTSVVALMPQDLVSGRVQGRMVGKPWERPIPAQSGSTRGITGEG